MSKSAACHPPWLDPAPPPRTDAVLPEVLERNALESPDREQIRFEGGAAWTCDQTAQRMRAAAALFAARGVKQGDTVVVWLPNGADLLAAWFGLNYLGAVFVPLNLEFRGALLEHALRESGAAVLVIHPELVERLEQLSELPVRDVLVCAQTIDSPVPGVQAIEFWPHHNAEAVKAASEAWHPQMVIFTSGTTGPSKGVLCPYLHMYSTAQATYGYLTSSDTMLVELPIFHVGGAAAVLAGLCNRATLAIYAGFSTGSYWERIRKENATSTSGLIGSMASFLYNTPATPEDADNPLRMLTLMLNAHVLAIAPRFGFSYISGFNMTELSGPLITDVDCQVAGSLGRPRSGCECRVVDEHDYDVPDGEPGELVVRSEYPWTMALEYLNRPEATAKAWRNGWFHTGDLVRRDSDGNFFFVDRKKDAIRRRGENVSSLEVEAEALSFPGVAEVCAVGVASEHGEEEILLVVVWQSGAEACFQTLAEYLIPRMAYFAVPRYFRSVEALPRTPTNKVRKVELREAGLTDDCWDREAAGLRLRRTRLN